MHPHDDVLQGLFSDSVIPIPLEVRRQFSEVWEIMEPSYIQIMVEVISPKEG